MDERPIVRDVIYEHAVIEGTSYEAGKQQGERIKAIPGLAAFLTSPFPDHAPLGAEEATEIMKFFDRHCPGVNEEIQGLADSLGAAPEQVVYYAITYTPQGKCSHFAVLPPVTANGHIYVGRSYEFNHSMTDMRLVTTRITGQAAHIGFSDVIFGRDDGLNQHGLCATISAGAPGAPVEPGGCTFWPVVRTVLDRCKTVDEALEVVESIPISFNFNLLLVDRTGQAARVEIACSHRAVKRIDLNGPESFLIATNHYNLPEMRPYDLGRFANSVRRYRVIEERLRSSAPQISVETLRSILSDPIPRGTCAHYYTEYMGTLWTAIFDVTQGTVEVCFGSPQCNPWHAFDMHGASGSTQYAVKLPDEVSDPAMWKKLPPGSDEI